jgi:hypothetical protein
MAAVVSLLAVIVMSLLITKVGAVALALTGISQEAARFQARSAVSGAGFTTSESERVVDHPARRQVISLLILLGGAGLLSSVATIVLSFAGDNSARTNLARAGVLAAGLVVVWLVTRSQRFDRVLTHVIQRVLCTTTDLEVRDYASLLHVRDGWTITELQVQDEDWVADEQLRQLDLPEEGVLVLGIHRTDGRWIGAPTGETRVRPGDTAVLYGRRDTIAELDQRLRDASGDDRRAASRSGFAEYRRHQQTLDRTTNERSPTPSD